MKFLRSARWMMLGTVLALSLLAMNAAPAHAGVLISVNIAPPPLLVYDQPQCPEPGWMWTPGYWAYDYDSGGYYWVPGTWVPAPYDGALWTPGYWGWAGGLYAWHPGYWGMHVGYYGGVNYGFGYMGVGFVGGMWRGNVFAYNRAVMHVDERVVRNVYEDRNVVVHNTIVNDRHVAFSGGPGGINHPPAPEERMADRDRHTEATSFQSQHVQAAQQDRGAFFNNNHGRPANVVVARPMTAPQGGNGGRPNGTQPNGATQSNPYFHDNGNAGSMPSNGRQVNNNPQLQGNNNPQQNNGYKPQNNNPQPQANPQQNNGNRPQGNPQPQVNPQPQGNPQQNNGYRPQNNNPQPQGNPQQNNSYKPQNNNPPPPMERPGNPRPQGNPQPMERPNNNPQPQPQPQQRQQPQPQPQQHQQAQPQPQAQQQQHNEQHGNDKGNDKGRDNKDR